MGETPFKRPTEIKLQTPRFWFSFRPGTRPANDISIALEMRPQFAVLRFKMYSSDHNEICTRHGSVTIVTCTKVGCDQFITF